MRVVSYTANGAPFRAGAMSGDNAIVDVAAVLRRAGLPEVQCARAAETRGFLSLGLKAWDLVASAAAAGADEDLIELGQVELGPPVTNPEKIICLGLNYRDHAEETGMAIPTSPIVFAKFPNSLVGPTQDIVIPDALGDEVDYEAELAVVFGSSCCDIDASEALDCLAGVMAFNDVSARAHQMLTSQWMLGKAIDTFAPCGPALVSLDEIEDVQDLDVSARVNGDTVQSGNTAAMIFGIAETIAYLSRLMTFRPGDVIATGTPAGVGMGRNPPLTLHPGDVVEIEIEGVGVLRNRVAAKVYAEPRSVGSGR
jgi:2-keto-4-pentenoate hydratase/2-oxohepta-3-ene-1,7-dioic acid hydratase in catechol pathway